MYCPWCGSQVPKGASYCGGCGRKLDGATPESQGQALAANDSLAAQAAGGAVPRSPSPPREASPPDGKSERPPEVRHFVKFAILLLAIEGFVAASELLSYVPLPGGRAIIDVWATTVVVGLSLGLRLVLLRMLFIGASIARSLILGFGAIGAAFIIMATVSYFVEPNPSGQGGGGRPLAVNSLHWREVRLGISLLYVGLIVNGFVTLRGPAVSRWFGWACPACDSWQVSSNFLETRGTCKACSATWRMGGRYADARACEVNVVRKV